MDAELLLCDIGNTCIKIGIANKDGIVTSYSLPTDYKVTADSLGLSLTAIMDNATINILHIKACVVSSVVPPMDPLITEAVSRYIGAPIIFVPADLPVPLTIDYYNPSEIGADRLAVSYAARQMYPDCASLIIVDYGTAVTFDCVKGNAYEGGLIFPGPGVATSALAQHASKLPYVNLRVCDPELKLMENTVTSIQHGIVYGYVSVTEGLCERLKKFLQPPIKVIGTGGFASTIARFSNIFNAVDPLLLLNGLRQLYYKNN